MFSLPDIERMNRAKVEALKKNADESQECEDCDAEGINEFKFFDIYSSTPMMEYRCDVHHRDFMEGWHDSFFDCDSCERTFMKNITWENHFVEVEGVLLCLNCHTDEIFDNNNDFTFQPGSKIDVNFDLLRKAPHVIGARNFNKIQELQQKGWRRHKSFTLDHFSGAEVAGFTHTAGSAEDVVDTLRRYIEESVDAGYVVKLVMPASYQFAVDVEVWRKNEN